MRKEVPLHRLGKPLGAASRLELEFRGHEPRVLPLHYAAIYTAFCPDAANRSKKNRRIKNALPRTWLGWLDLNQRMWESKSHALPLGDTPI